jgi:hypothetical protein
MTAGVAFALLAAIAGARSSAGLDAFVLCSDWPERTFGGQLRRGGPAHCTCEPGQTKEHLGAQEDFGWHCTDNKDPAAYCEFDAICSHCKGLGWWPVCGVDGRTYSSACRAKCKCVAVASEGACDGWAVGGQSDPSPLPDAASTPTARPGTPKISARVQITHADGTELTYHSRPPSSDPTVADYLAAAPDATTKLQQMELLHEHTAKSSVQSPQLPSSPPPPPSDENDDPIPAHLSDWHGPEGADAKANGGADEESCDSEDGTCFERSTAARKDSGEGDQGEAAAAKEARRASYGKSPQANAYSSSARDYASKQDENQRPNTLKQEL